MAMEISAYKLPIHLYKKNLAETDNTWSYCNLWVESINRIDTRSSELQLWVSSRSDVISGYDNQLGKPWRRFSPSEEWEG